MHLQAAFTRIRVVHATAALAEQAIRVACDHTQRRILGHFARLGRACNRQSWVAITCELEEPLAATELGIPPDKPTLVMTDNKANALVGSGAGTLRSRHAIRRWVTFLQRVQTGACILRFLPDEQNPADFLTKPVPAAKLETSKLWLQGKPP